MKFKIKHKTEGWTGILELDDFVEDIGYSSHRCFGKINYVIEQDSYKADGTYVEDPDVNNLDDIEFIELVK